MPRELIVAAAQLGPIARDEHRRSVVGRLIMMLEKAAARGATLVVFPELALTTFFPRWYMEDQNEIDPFFETEMLEQFHAAALRACQRIGCRLLPRLCRTRARDRASPTLQHGHPGRWQRRHRAPLPKGAPTRSQGARALAGLPASRKALFRTGGRAVLAGRCHGRPDRTRDLQRSALAGGLS